MQLRDRTFQRVFKSFLIYNILFEDIEVDQRFLRIDSRSRILSITGAGCGVVNQLQKSPRSIDAVDINRHHLALTALKVTAARQIRSYGEFYSLLGRGEHHNTGVLLPKLVKDLPRWIGRYWKRHHSLFADAFHRRGLTARMFELLRRISGCSTELMQRMVAMSVVERIQFIEAHFGPIMGRPWLRRLLSSPLNLLALGINYTQCERLLASEKTDLAGFILQHLKRVAMTDLSRNWFAWWGVAGHYNHALPDAVPPYLRREVHAESLRATSEIRFHNRNLFDVLSAAGPGTWTHYTLCDIVDWLPAGMQRQLFDQIFRTSVDGAVVLYRSVLSGSLIERHGLGQRFRLLKEDSELASQLDRTRQFRSVNFYVVTH
jgi:S-adenosylmethionine-diacylglycerol 3-amino-3-carboxypropyl transferase